MPDLYLPYSKLESLLFPSDCNTEESRKQIIADKKKRRALIKERHNKRLVTECVSDKQVAVLKLNEA